MDQTNNSKRLALGVVDGLGLSSSWNGNALLSAAPANFERMWRQYPHVVLKNKSNNDQDVAVNHAIMSTGRFYQSPSECIKELIKSAEFKDNKTIKRALDYTEQHYSSIHVFTGLSAENAELLESFLNIFGGKCSSSVFIHLVVGDNLTTQEEVLDTLDLYEKIIQSNNAICLSTICGEKYLSNNSDRLQTLLKLLVWGEGNHSLSPEQIVFLQRAEKPSEYEPRSIYAGNFKTGMIRDFDSIIILDRLSKKYAPLLEKLFEGSSLSRGQKALKFLHAAGFYSPFSEEKAYFDAVFEREKNKTLAQSLCDRSIKQIYISETSRFYHITSYFQDCRSDNPFINNVFFDTPTLYPDYIRHYPNICGKILNRTVDSIKNQEHSFIYFELPFLDIINQHGNMSDILSGVKLFDQIIGKLEEIFLDQGVPLIISSNKGGIENCSKRISENDVSLPLIYISENKLDHLKAGEQFSATTTTELLRSNNWLTDLAPTIYDYFNIEKPASIEGTSMINKLAQT